MADKKRNEIECRSKEGLEADIPRRVVSFGGIGKSETIINCNPDDLYKITLDENGDNIPPNFIKVDH